LARIRRLALGKWLAWLPLLALRVWRELLRVAHAGWGIERRPEWLLLRGEGLRLGRLIHICIVVICL
jgi:hypothetical protein